MERMELGGCCIEEKGESGEREREREEKEREREREKRKREKKERERKKKEREKRKREKERRKFTMVWRRWRGGDCGSSGCCGVGGEREFFLLSLPFSLPSLSLHVLLFFFSPSSSSRWTEHTFSFPAQFVWIQISILYSIVTVLQEKRKKKVDKSGKKEEEIERKRRKKK